MVAAAHFATFFLGLEIIGVSLYGLIGYLRRRKGPLEAALKYLVLSGTASAPSKCRFWGNRGFTSPRTALSRWGAGWGTPRPMSRGPRHRAATLACRRVRDAPNRARNIAAGSEKGDDGR